jgi:hypothetical protein
MSSKKLEKKGSSAAQPKITRADSDDEDEDVVEEDEQEDQANESVSSDEKKNGDYEVFIYLSSFEFWCLAFSSCVIANR